VKHSRTLWIPVLAATLLAGCLGKKKAAPIAGTSAEPDKVLFAKATEISSMDGTPWAVWGCKP